MKTISLISERFYNEVDHIAHESKYGLLTMYNANLRIGLFEIEDEYFDENDPALAESVLVRKKAFSLNFRDKALTMQVSSHLNRSNSMLHWPIGSEFSGIVEKTGHSVTNVKVGDRVITNSAYPTSGDLDALSGLATNNSSKEYEIIHASKLIRMPDAMPFEIGAAFTVGGQTTYGMINKLKLSGDEHVLVTSGSSCTSQFLISGLSKKVASVTVLTSQESFASQLKKLGATNVVTIPQRNNILNNEDFQKIFYLLKGFNVVVDPFSDIHLPQLIKTLKVGGKYITCGIYNQIKFSNSQGNNASDEMWSDLLLNLITRNITIYGNCLGSTKDLEQALLSYENGELQVLIDSVFEAEDFEAFCNRSFWEKEKFGKVILRF